MTGSRPPALAWLVLASVLAMLLAGCSAGEAGEPDGDGTGKGSADAASIRFTPAGAAGPVPPTAPISVTASEGTLEQVSMTAAGGEPVPGRMTGASAASTWRASGRLDYATTYTITATAVSDGGSPVTETSTVRTVDPQALAYPSMSPLDGMTVGIGHPVAIYFDTPVQNKQAAQRAIEVTTEPAVNGAFHWFSDTEVHWRPREFWQPGTRVSVDINLYGVNLGGGVYGETDREVDFTIGDAVIARADGATHTMTVEINGELVRTFPISMGRPEYPSTTGIHVVTQQYRRYEMDSRSFGLGLDEGGYVIDTQYSSRISNSGEFVHGAPWSVAAQGERNVSHGCINLSIPDARWFYNHTRRGDVVIATNTGGPPLEPSNGFGDWQLSWQEWKQDGVS